MSKEKLNGQATEEQIKEWKEKHGKVYFTKADGHIAYFRKPKRQEIGYSMTLQNDPLKASEALLKSCFVGGSEVFITDAGFLLGAAELMDKLISIKKVELGEL
jgi:hypothetical protein